MIWLIVARPLSFALYILNNMNSDRKILLAEIESSLKILGVPFSLIEERKLPIFQDASKLVVSENNFKVLSGNRWELLKVMTGAGAN